MHLFNIFFSQQQSQVFDNISRMTFIMHTEMRKVHRNNSKPVFQAFLYIAIQIIFFFHILIFYTYFLQLIFHVFSAPFDFLSHLILFNGHITIYILPLTPSQNSVNIKNIATRINFLSHFFSLLIIFSIQWK